MMKSSSAPPELQARKTERLRSLDGKTSVWEVFPFALQQVLAMLVTNMVPIGLIASAAVPALSEAERLILAQNAMIAAGIATFIQAFPLWRIGSGLPIFMGTSFTFVVPLAAIAMRQGYGTVAGAVIIGGIFEGVLGLSAKYWKRLISPIVSAVVVTAIGLSLLPTAAQSFGGGTAEDFGSMPNLLTGSAALLTCVVWKIRTKGIHKQLAVLAGLTAGFLLSLVLGLADLSHLLDHGWVSLPKLLPVMPVFDLHTVFSICVIYIVSAAETMGDTSAFTDSLLGREISAKEISGVLTADGFGSLIAGLFGVTPVTSYSENIGIAIMSRVANRNVAKAGAGILILCGLFPLIGAFLSSIPKPVLGGILLVIMGQILVSGIEMISKAGFTARNKLITVLSLAVGIGFGEAAGQGIWAYFPILLQSIFSKNIVSVVFATVFLLNLLLPSSLEEQHRNSSDGFKNTVL